MALSRLFFIAAFCFATTLTYAAGIDLIEVPADKDGPALRGAVWKSRCDISRTQFAKATCGEHFHEKSVRRIRIG